VDFDKEKEEITVAIQKKKGALPKGKKALPESEETKEAKEPKGLKEDKSKKK